MSQQQQQQQDDSYDVTKAAKGVTSTIGSTASGATNLTGGVLGAVGRGVGEMVEGTTGSEDLGNMSANIGNSVQDGTKALGKAQKNLGEWKSPTADVETKQ